MIRIYHDLLDYLGRRIMRRLRGEAREPISIIKGTRCLRSPNGKWDNGHLLLHLNWRDVLRSAALCASVLLSIAALLAVLFGRRESYHREDRWL